MFLRTLTLSSLLALPLLQTTLATSAHIQKNCNKKPPARPTDGDPGELTLYTPNSLIYIVNITIGGDSYPVQLDTGSSDLWVKPDHPVKGADISDTSIKITYGIGYAEGRIGTAQVDFAGFEVEKQAYIDVTKADNPVFKSGAVGIVGVGFTSLSGIDQKLELQGEEWGKSLLYNIFAQYPDEPNYIAFYLKRSPDPNVYVEGSFTIGEVEEDYKDVMNRKALPTWPVHNPTRWNVLLDGYSFKGGPMKSIKSGVKGVPSGKSVVLLDSGTSLIYGPKVFVDEILDTIPEAKFDKESGVYVVPCDTEIDLTFSIGGDKYPIDPLDLVLEVQQDVCVLAFTPEDSNGEIDLILGDSFLRSVYSLYDFGDFKNGTKEMGDPYVKLLSIVDADKASQTFRQERGGGSSSSGSGKNNEPDHGGSDPDNGGNDPDNSGNDPDNDNGPTDGEPDDGSKVPDDDDGSLGTGNVGSGVSNVDSSPSTTGASKTIQDVYNKLQSGVKYLGIALGIVGFVALLLGCACGAAIMAFLGRRKPRKDAATKVLLPTSMRGPAASAGFGAVDSDASSTYKDKSGPRGSYAPVSMYNEETGKYDYEEPKYGHGGH